MEMCSSVGSCKFWCLLVLAAVSLMCLDEFRMRLLWLSMICLVLFMQL